MNTSQGIVIKSTGKWFSVTLDDNRKIECGIKGKFRMKGFDSTNPVAVGDRVDIKLADDRNSGTIVGIHDRKNYIIRKSIKLSKLHQIMAANVDQTLLIVTIAWPETLTGFIDRYLVSAEAYRIPAILVFNKTDLYGEPEKARLTEWTAMYEKIGYKCIAVSALEKINVDLVASILKDKISVLSGNSGVGKSSLINAVDSLLHLKTGSISDAYDTGKHITTFAEMFALQQGGYIIDTPGIRGFGMIDMDPGEIYHYFPEIFKVASRCKYHNCSHVHEPECEVLAAVQSGDIALSRYQSYLSILQGDEKKYR